MADRETIPAGGWVFLTRCGCVDYKGEQRNAIGGNSKLAGVGNPLVRQFGR